MENSHKYSVSGMSCDGCKTHVEQSLNKIPGVSSAKVDLAQKEAIVTAEKEISLEQLNEPFAGTSYQLLPYQQGFEKKK